MVRLLRCSVVLILGLFVCGVVTGADWPQFRGPGGAAAAPGETVLTEWSDSEGIVWKVALPGPGASSPIVFGDRVFVTCYSGYGVPGGERGRVEDLKRHLVCVARRDGEVLWQRTVDARLPEDSYSGMGVPEHGYASNTPVTDGERVYVFFGKTGVFAFDWEGNQLWQTHVGQESSNRRWGSAASLILHENLVIVNASEESQSIRGLEKATGKEIWKAEAEMLELAYNTPVLVELPDDEVELVVGVPYEVWGLRPDTGKLKWYAEIRMDGNISPSAVAADGVVYVIGGYRTKGSVAICAGGEDDVTDSHMVWGSNNSSYIPSPVFDDGRLHWVSDQGIAYCVDAATGEAIYRERLPSAAGGGRGKPFYASAILAGEYLYAVSRTGGAFVLDRGPSFNVVAHNVIEADKSQFNATPAVADGQLYLRSDRYLYCLGAGE